MIRTEPVTVKRADIIRTGDVVLVPPAPPSTDAPVRRTVTSVVTAGGWTRLGFDDGTAWTPRQTRLVDMAPALAVVPARPLADVLAEHVAEVNYRRLVTAIGGGFHPDTRGADYVTLPAGITPDMVDQTIDAALDADLDVYDIAIEIMPI